MQKIEYVEIYPEEIVKEFFDDPDFASSLMLEFSKKNDELDSLSMDFGEDLSKNQLENIIEFLDDFKNRIKAIVAFNKWVEESEKTNTRHNAQYEYDKENPQKRGNGYVIDDVKGMI